LCLKQVTISKAVRDIAAKYEVPIGLEVLYPDRDAKADINIVSGNLKDILDALIQAFPGYKWSVENDIVEILPVGFQETILDVSVSEYKTDLRNEFGLRKSITDLPEVRKKLNEMEIEPFLVVLGSSSAVIVDKGFSLRMRNETVRAILSELAKNSINRYWIVSRNDESIFVYL
jgi:hypothetical protein